ncbi:MAG TPA: ABC transporter permease [Methylomirabilota bacterium]|nr:ABC transporter permease [Methylomirabilota bacterium]
MSVMLRRDAGAGVPWIVIDPTSSRPLVEVRELWHYRDLLYFLTWRDISVRYKQTVLGFLWAILQPFLTMVVFAIFLGRLAGMPSDGVPYPVFSYLGLLPWSYFSGAVTRAGTSVVGNAHLLTRVYFPRVLVPLSATLSALVDFAIASLVLGGLMAWYGIVPARTAALLLPLAALTALAATGIGMWLAALNVRYRDVQYAIPFLMQLWMFATPVVYPTSLVPPGWQPLFALNPMTGIIEAYRAAVLGTALDWPSLGISTLSATVLAALGAWQFHRMEQSFADQV